MSHAPLPGPSVVCLVQQRLINLIGRKALRVPERARAGVVLGHLSDPRPGVGVDMDGLPDIDWIALPQGEFFLGKTRERTVIAAPFRTSR